MYSNLQSRIHCWIHKPQWRRKYKDDEWFDVVTEQGKALGQAPRSVCHEGPFLLHPVVHLHLLDKEGRIYLQQRQWTKKIQPGKWDTAVGGHVDAGEAIDTALMRESREELGIEGFTPHSLGRYVWEYPVEAELVHSYWTIWNGEINWDPEEIVQGRFWEIKELEEELTSDAFTPNFRWEWKKVLKPAMKEMNFS